MHRGLVGHRGRARLDICWEQHLFREEVMRAHTRRARQTTRKIRIEECSALGSVVNNKL